MKPFFVIVTQSRALLKRAFVYLSARHYIAMKEIKKLASLAFL